MAAVGLDVFFEDGATGVSPLNITSGLANTPGSIAANLNRALIVAVISRTDSIGTITGTWDGTTLDVLGTVNPGGSLGFIRFLGVLTPATGSKVLSIAWTGGSDTVTVMCWSLYNVLQSAGAYTQNFGSSNATSTALTTGAIASAVGNMVVGAAFDNDSGSGTFGGGATSDIRDGRFSGNYHAAHQASAGASVTLSGTIDSVFWLAAGLDVIATAAGGRTTKNTRSNPLGTEIGMNWSGNLAPAQPERRIWAMQQGLYRPMADRYDLSEAA